MQPRNRLLTGRLMAVQSMPEGLDRWLVEDLQRWGRYRITVDPEGADLVMRAYNPEKELQFKIHRGIPQPKREKHEPPPVLSVSVIDWVDNKAVWQADLLNKKPKQETESRAGPETRIDARGLKPQELAHEIAARLQQYVAELERTERRK